MNINMKKVRRIGILTAALGYFALSKYCEKLSSDNKNSMNISSQDIDNNKDNCDCYVKLPSNEKNI